MKETTNCHDIISCGNVFQESEVILQTIKSKRLLYGETLRQNAAAWRSLGFPIDELGMLITRFHECLRSRIWPHLCNVNSYAASLISIDEKGTNWEKPLALVLEAVIIASDTIQLLGKSMATLELLKATTELSTLYLNKTLFIIRSLFKPHRVNDKKVVRFPDAKGTTRYLF
jgi:hypothetical protein